MDSKQVKLSQVLAEEKQVKARVDRAITDLFKEFKTPAKFQGHLKTYQPLREADDNGQPVEVFPPEVQSVAVKADQSLLEIRRQLEDLFSVSWQKDLANTMARADIVVNEKVIATAVPVTHLLWLEKQLTLLKSVVDAIPTLDPSEQWMWDAANHVYSSAPVKRARTEKSKIPVVLYPATEKHPAQTQLLDQDKVVGYWTHVKTSGAVIPSDVTMMAKRLEAVLCAVKKARAEANSATIDPFVSMVTADLLGYIFDGSLPLQAS